MGRHTSFPEWHGANMPQPPGLDDEPEDGEDWIDEEAASLVEPHVSGGGYVVRDLDDNYLRAADGSCVQKFETWADAYVAAVVALKGNEPWEEPDDRCDNCGGLVDDQGYTIDLFGCCTYCKAD